MGIAKSAERRTDENIESVPAIVKVEPSVRVPAARHTFFHGQSTAKSFPDRLDGGNEKHGTDGRAIFRPRIHVDFNFFDHITWNTLQFAPAVHQFVVDINERRTPAQHADAARTHHGELLQYIGGFAKLAEYRALNV